MTEKAEQPGVEVIVTAAAEVYRILGPGLPEKVYVECLTRELSLRGVHVQSQVPVRLTYKGVRLDHETSLPLLVEGTVAVWVEALAELSSLHEARLRTCMKFGGWKQGVLLSFHVTRFEDGVRRLTATESDS
ncbi:MAG TPA: GxxExxY protein [Candidatus Ozemobacteraceae bacterium]|nr:GxxExxY protein [Candidatus Ozemobacteraceae bacterium]